MRAVFSPPPLPPSSVRGDAENDTGFHVVDYEGMVTKTIIVMSTEVLRQTSFI